jgi:2-keto-4-pentenoate hydratase/2-oxohepta-3-ene-1,7-dioic acid hydratase in catechol pathway
MKLVTFGVETPLGLIERIGALANGRIIDLSAAYQHLLSDRGIYAAETLANSILPPDMVAFLERWPFALDAAHEAVAFANKIDGDQAARAKRIWYNPTDTVPRIALRPRRIKDYLVYERHKRKAMEKKGLTMPDLWYRMPTYTNRNIMGYAHPGDDILWPSYSNKLDFEFEIGMVIGKSGKNIKAEDAAPFIAGFTIYNDWSARDTQADEGTIGAGAGKSKDFDQGNVLGPCIVTADELDPANIEMHLRVNGEEWSRGNTNGMKFTWGQIIENASRDETIFPGDVFASGTMDDGCSLELGKWINDRDVIEMEAKGIGVLMNRVRRS